QRDRELQLPGALGEQRLIGEAHQLARQLLESQGQTQLGANARRLTRGQCDAWCRDHPRLCYDLYSTNASSRMHRSQSSVSSSAFRIRSRSARSLPRTVASSASSLVFMRMWRTWT